MCFNLYVRHRDGTFGVCNVGHHFFRTNVNIFDIETSSPENNAICKWRALGMGIVTTKEVIKALLYGPYITPLNRRGHPRILRPPDTHCRHRIEPAYQKSRTGVVYRRWNLLKDHFHFRHHEQKSLPHVFSPLVALLTLKLILAPT